MAISFLLGGMTLAQIPTVLVSNLTLPESSARPRGIRLRMDWNLRPVLRHWRTRTTDHQTRGGGQDETAEEVDANSQAVMPNPACPACPLCSCFWPSPTLPP